MNILIVSNMYPSVEKKYSGLFVLNQFNELKSQLNSNEDIDFFYMKRTMTNFLGSVIKYMLFFVKFPFFVLDKRKKYDIVHVHYYYPTIYIALLYKFIFNSEVKIIVTFHGADVDFTKKTIFYKLPLKYIDLAIGVSDNLSKKISSFYKGEVLTISAGIMNDFKPEKRFKSLANREYDLLYVGSFYKADKGFDILIKILKNIELQLNICFIGSGDQEYLINQIKSFHKITKINDLCQSEIIKYYYNSRYLINTSRMESFGLVIAESMSCGTPVIATKTDGSLQQIKNRGNGFFIPTENTLEQTKIIQEKLKISEVNYKEISLNGIKDAAKYKLSNITNQLVSIYKTINS
ncbi:MAG: glycosyltransferase [Gammaproteobacteria bacterium]|jgi:L-malate glycosyltransferase|nr:glycosyltransferase [Gammaproteobacteria bacterium]